MKKILLLTVLIVVLILEVLPFGAVLEFIPDGSETAIVQTFSYFDLTPFGYANFAPFLTALLTIALLINLGILFWKRKGLRVMQILSAVAALMSVLPAILFGTVHITAVSVCITVLLLAQSVFLFFCGKKQ